VTAQGQKIFIHEFSSDGTLVGKAFMDTQVRRKKGKKPRLAPLYLTSC
jgi:hypothetical protein